MDAQPLYDLAPVARLMLRAYKLTEGQILFRRANDEIVSAACERASSRFARLNVLSASELSLSSAASSLPRLSAP